MSDHILVTGGAGFIGSNFIRYLQKNQPQIAITNLDLLTYAGSLENLKNLPILKSITSLRATSAISRWSNPSWQTIRLTPSFILQPNPMWTGPSKDLERSSKPTSSAPFPCLKRHVKFGLKIVNKKENRSDSITFRPMRSMVPWRLRILPSKNPHPMNPIPLMPPQKRAATTWCGLTLTHLGCQSQYQTALIITVPINSPKN